MTRTTTRRGQIMEDCMTWTTITKGQIMEDCMKRITTRKRTDHGELYDKDHDKEKGKNIEKFH